MDEVVAAVGGVVGSGAAGGTDAPPAVVEPVDAALDVLGLLVAGIGGGGAVAAGVETGVGAGVPDGGTVVAAPVGEDVADPGGDDGMVGAGDGGPAGWVLAAQLVGATIVTLTFTGVPALLVVDVAGATVEDAVGWVAGLEVVDAGDGDEVGMSAGLGSWPAPAGEEVGGAVAMVGTGLLAVA